MNNTEDYLKDDEQSVPKEDLAADERKQQKKGRTSEAGQDLDTEKKVNDGSRYENLEHEELIELLEEQQQKNEELSAQVKELEDAKLRRAAELENIKKRVQRDRAQIFEAAKITALEDFLPVNDDLQRTLKALRETDVEQNFIDGVALIANKFEEVLKKQGVERSDEEGVPFNVDFHDAMMRQKPEDDEVESDVVLKVLENGYRIGDRTIRHAKVIVSE
ncbi:MAG: nucleotide exchange factor GrpE [Balneolaceae bacterium]